MTGSPGPVLRPWCGAKAIGTLCVQWCGEKERLEPEEGGTLNLGLGRPAQAGTTNGHLASTPTGPGVKVDRGVRKTNGWVGVKGGRLGSYGLEGRRPEMSISYAPSAMRFTIAPACSRPTKQPVMVDTSGLDAMRALAAESKDRLSKSRMPQRA